MNYLRSLVRLAFPHSVPEVDLHGLRVAEALDTVERALQQAQQTGAREIRIVCGKGKGSKGGVGVLREAVPGWLEARGYAGRFRREVDGEGRDGSIRVILGESNRQPPVDEK